MIVEVVSLQVNNAKKQLKAEGRALDCCNNDVALMVVSSYSDINCAVLKQLQRRKEAALTRAD